MSIESWNDITKSTSYNQLEISPLEQSHLFDENSQSFEENNFGESLQLLNTECNSSNMNNGNYFGNDSAATEGCGDNILGLDHQSHSQAEFITNSQYEELLLGQANSSMLLDYSGLLLPNEENDVQFDQFDDVDPSISGLMNRQDDGGLGSENLCFENYQGDYGFQVLPVTAQKKKLFYSVEAKKLFCTKNTHEFEVKINFEKIHQPESFRVRVHLAFTEAEHQNQPVKKCLNCSEMQQKNGEDASTIPHVVRGAKNDINVSYKISPVTGRCYLSFPIKKPEPGSSAITKSVEFTCMSSCKSVGGINRRPIAIIFTLLDELNIVIGRSVMKLRVCSAPNRDFIHEFGQNAANKRKGMLAETKIKSEPESNDTNAALSVRTVPIVPERRRLVGDENNSQEQSSSQETAYSDDEDATRPKIKLRKLMKETKVILAWRKSTVTSKRICAKNMYSCLKTVQEICETGKTIADNPE